MKKYLLLAILLIFKFSSDSFAGGCAFITTVNPSNSFDFTFTYNGWVGLQTYSWNFGDGIGTSNLQNPTYTYSTAGVYTVTLNTVDTNGITCNSIATVTVTITGSGCDFVFSGGGLPPATVLFTSTSIGSGITYSWDFGDGSVINTLANPSHTYVVPGTYNVCLTTVDNGGQTCVICHPVIIGSACHADFTASTLGLDAYFIDHSIVNPANISYNWNFGDGITSTARFPFHQYLQAGNYTVMLFISDGSTCFDSIVKTVIIDTIPLTGCSANFVFTEIAPYQIDVVNISYGQGNLSYLWDFGDGSSSTQSYPSHTYASTGTYNICLTLNDGNGCTSTYCDSLNVDSSGNITSRFLAGFTINVVAPSDISTGINNSASEIVDAVYPNPSHDRLFITLKNQSGTYNCSIHSLSGSTIFKGKLNEGINSLNIEAFESGSYIIEIVDQAGNCERSRFVKM